MNAKPQLTPKNQAVAREDRLLPQAFAVMVLCGLMISSGCADSTAAKSPSPSAQTVVAPTKTESPTLTSDPSTSGGNGPDQENQDDHPDQSASGVLGTASKLLEQAKSKGGSTALGAGQWVQDKLNAASQAGSHTADDTWKWANDTFESLKSQGLTTATSTGEWLGQDWSNMESWEYKVITLSGTDDELAERLNEFGKLGWECFNAEGKTESTRFYLKKPTFSYLRQLPFKDVIKLIPMMNNNGGK